MLDENRAVPSIEVRAVFIEADGDRGAVDFVVPGVGQDSGARL